MNLSELFTEIEDDLEINTINIQEKLFRVPKLHAKYLELFFKYKKTLIKKNKGLRELYTDKYTKYKNGDELLDKKEIQFYILSDTEYSKLKFEVDSLEHIVDVLDRTVKKVNTLSFDCKNIIEYLKFINGE